MRTKRLDRWTMMDHRTECRAKHAPVQLSAKRLLSLAAASAVAAFAGSAQAANSGDVFKTTATDLSVGTNYTTTITPTAATTVDAQFSGSYAGGTTFTINGAALSFGTLNDIDTAQSLVISNTNATAGSITLNTASNSTAGSNAADLLFVKAGANLTLQNGTGTLALDLVNTGNIDNAGTLSLASPINITSAKVVTLTGAGSTSISGSFAATTGAVTVADPGRNGHFYRDKPLHRSDQRKQRHAGARFFGVGRSGVEYHQRQFASDAGRRHAKHEGKR